MSDLQKCMPEPARDFNVSPATSGKTRLVSTATRARRTFSGAHESQCSEWTGFTKPIGTGKSWICNACKTRSCLRGSWVMSAQTVSSTNRSNSWLTIRRTQVHNPVTCQCSAQEAFHLGNGNMRLRSCRRDTAQIKRLPTCPAAQDLRARPITAMGDRVWRPFCAATYKRTVLRSTPNVQPSPHAEPLRAPPEGNKSQTLGIYEIGSSCAPAW